MTVSSASWHLKNFQGVPASVPTRVPVLYPSVSCPDYSQQWGTRVCIKNFNEFVHQKLFIIFK